MEEQLDFEEILARNPHLGREAVERAKALQRALREIRERQRKYPNAAPRPFGTPPRAMTPDDPTTDPRVTSMPRASKTH